MERIGNEPIRGMSDYGMSDYGMAAHGAKRSFTKTTTPISVNHKRLTGIPLCCVRCCVRRWLRTSLRHEPQLVHGESGDRCCRPGHMANMLRAYAENTGRFRWRHCDGSTSELAVTGSLS